MPWIEPIYDRTPADVAYVLANRNSPEPLKGARNYTDLQRVTGNIHYLAKTLSECGCGVPPLQCKTTWELCEIPAESEIDKIRIDLNALKEAFFVFLTNPPTPGLPHVNYRKRNDIERILYDINTLIGNMTHTIDLAWTINTAHIGAWGAI